MLNIIFQGSFSIFIRNNFVLNKSKKLMFDLSLKEFFVLLILKTRLILYQPGCFL